MANPGITTLATIRTAAQRRADQENSLFLTTPEWTANINASYQELFDLLVQKYGNDYYAALDSTGGGFQITTTGTSDKFALPNGSSTYTMADGTTTAPAFYKLLGVELQVSNSTDDWVTLKPFAFIERNSAGPSIQAARGRDSNLRYRLIGNIGASTPTQYLWLKPLPMAGQIVRVWYIPRLTALSADADTVDGVSGWEEYIVIDAAIKALQKEESDVTILLAQKMAIIQRLEAAAENRDAGSPMVVGNTRRQSGWGDDIEEEWP